jgi:hypothetical protein
MRHLKSYTFLFVALCTTVFTFPGCESKQPLGIYRNDKIGSDTREKIHSLNDLLVSASKEGKLTDVENIMAKDMLTNPEYKHTVEMIGNESKSGKYTLLDEYYINNAKEGHNNDLAPESKDYKLGFHSETAESYLSLILLENNGDKWLLLAGYGKYDYGWRLNTLNIGHYAINGKTAAQLLTFAKQQQQKGYLVNALNNMEWAVKCMRPVEAWQYTNEDEISNYYGKVARLAAKAYQTPIIIPIATKPHIFRIMTQTSKEGGYVPTIKYLSTINIHDIPALQKEFEGVKKSIGKVLPGIDHDNKCIIFSVYNEQPDGNKNPISYDMMYDLK